MSYAYSDVDEKLIKWFANDFSCALLRDLELSRGHIRSLHPFEIVFEYPIAAIAGRNGSGKSTLLAMAACAFHSSKNEIPLVTRKYPYFRFRDFLVQSVGEAPVDDVTIIYGIAHDRWKPTPEDTLTQRVGYQHRVKPKGGKWNDYALRVHRPVAFLGIDRVVPHSEKSTSKSYRYNFASIDRAGWEDEVRKRVSKVLGNAYEDFEFSRYTKYRLPKVRRGGNSYSGFNMGAGENALFELFAILLASPKGTLAIVDEIELGLHEEAQMRLIRELKEVCLERKAQIICTTHSGTILRALPPEGRYFLESYKGKTIVTAGISPAYATGRLAGENSRELDIFVEDDIAGAIVEAALDSSMRARVSVIPIGSASAVVSQMAARKRDVKNGSAIAIMDGDQKTSTGKHAKAFAAEIERGVGGGNTVAASDWFRKRLEFLPGSDWPELWLLQTAKTKNLTAISRILRTSEETLNEAIEQAILAGKHNEFYALANALHCNQETVLRTFAQCVVGTSTKAFKPIRKLINQYLNS